MPKLSDTAAASSSKAKPAKKPASARTPNSKASRETLKPLNAQEQKQLLDLLSRII